MCPFCFATLGTIIAGTISVGGVAAAAVTFSLKKNHAAEPISSSRVSASDETTRENVDNQ